VANVPKFYHGSFFTDNSANAPDVEAVVGRYKKSIREHIEAHLKLMFKSVSHTHLDFEEIARRTVYGEYELVLDGNNAVFKFTDDDIMGIYDTSRALETVNGIPMTWEDTTPNWFSNEINTTGNGVKFMLPSLGTEVVKLHTFGNQTDLIKKCFINEVKAFCRHFHNNNSFDLSDMPIEFHLPLSTPTEVFDDIMTILASTNTAPNPFPDYSPVPLIVLRQILESLNPEEISRLNTNSIANTVRDEYNRNYHSSDKESTMEITSTIFGKLFAKSSAQIDEYTGSALTLVGNRSTHIRDYFADTHGIDPDEYNYEYRLTRPITTTNGIDTSRIALWDISNNSQLGSLYPDGIELDAGNHRSVSENQFKIKPTYQADGVGDARRGKGIPLSAAAIVNQRVMLDAFFYMQLYTHLHEKYDTDFGDTDKWNESNVKLRYISDLSNTTHRRTTILDRHLNLRHPKDSRAGPPTRPKFKEFYKTEEKRGEPLVSVLTGLRGYYTGSILSIIRSKSVDKEIMDRVYASSLLKQEVSWLIGAVSDSGKALVEKRVDNDPLTRVQYQSIASPAGGGPQEIGYAPKRTVFYEVESPLFKDIVSLYSEVFNEFTIMNAYRKEEVKDIKEAELARSIWTNLEKRNTNIFDREDIIPFRLFNILFKRIEEKARESSIVANIYPDTWSATNNVTLLRADPLTTGQPIEREFYQARLNEFITHLSRAFKTNHRIPAIVVSVIEQAKISSTKDVTALKREFEERLDRDARLKKLSSTTTRFHAYELMISILRAYIMIDDQTRNEFVAQKIDDGQRDQIGDNLRAGKTEFATPDNYPTT